MRFVTAIIHHVENLRAAEDFFCQQLGFYRANRSEYGVFLENGAVALRLISQTDAPLTPLHLEIFSKQLNEDCAALLRIESIELISEQHRVHPTRLEICLQAPHGVTITLYQEFDEDELGILPNLPIHLDWETPAIDCIQQLLTYVPVDFRSAARRRVVERAEEIAAEQGEITVILPMSVQALAEVTPHFQHPALVAALQERGIDPLDCFHCDNL